MRIQRTKGSWCGLGVVAVVALGHGDAALGQIGACCRGDGVCIATDGPGCTAITGEFLGAGTVCDPGICSGACCTANKGCAENNRDACTAVPGTFQGAGSTCELNCPSFLATAFTYQGQLKVGGIPVSDTVDLECSLWTAAIGGTQVDVTQSLPGVEVVNGLFTIDLDFGPTAFAGNTRWLEIVVDGTRLSPRQALTATPYAVNATQLDGQSAAFYQNASNISSGTLGDLRLSSNVALLNAAQTFSAGKTFSVAPSFTAGGAPFNVSSTTLVANLNADRLDGLDSTAFLQSIPNPLTLSGTSATHIIRGDNASTGPASIGVYGRSTAASGETYGVYGRSDSTSGRGAFGYATAASGTTHGGYFLNHSTSGIGVRGWATAATGGTYGLWGQSDSTSGFGAFGEATAASGTTYGLYGRSASTDGRGVFGYASAASGTTYGVYGQSDSSAGFAGYFVGKGSDALYVKNDANGRGIQVLATNDTALWASTTAGIAGVDGRNASTTGRGVYGYATAASGENYGVYGRTSSTEGRGVFGLASADSGVADGGRFETNSTSGRGVVGSAGAGSGITFGGYFESASTRGRGVYSQASATSGTTYGVYGQSDSSAGFAGYFVGKGDDALYVKNDANGRGIHVLATNDTALWASTTAGIAGVDGRNASTTGRGVYGYATATSGENYGVYGRTSSSTGRGVYGVATATGGGFPGSNGGRFESAGSYGTGVVGEASATGPGTLTYGVRGSAAGYAVYATGDMAASGTKPFRIDHPDDPENKYLLHYAAESPEVINFYSGKATLDGAGEAVVELPHYFAKINTDPRYTLTAVGAPMPKLHVAEEIDEAALSAGATAGPGVAAPVCSFRIAGGAPRAKVSWRVEAIRNDLWARNRAVPVEAAGDGLSIQTRVMPVEVEKQGIEKGTYQHPELYGQPPEKGMNYDAERERTSPADTSEATPR